MRKIGIVVVALCVLLPAVIASACFPSGGRAEHIAGASVECDCGDDLSALYDAYWEVDVPGGVGSGVAVSNCDILTAAHVVDGQDSVTVKHEDAPGVWRVLEAVVVKRGDAEKGPDLALLRVSKGANLKPLPRCGKLDIKLGEQAAFAGTPEGVHGMLELTIVSKLRLVVSNQPLFAINGRGWFGDSGGPVAVKRAGKWVLAGITVRIAWGQGKAPTLAVQPDTIADFLGEKMEACR